MSSASSAVDLFGLDPATWTRPVLHAGDRIWTETNCYVDLWAELLPALGHPAEAALPFTVLQDFEGDHFTFFKFPLDDLRTLFGIAVQELAIYDSVEVHTLEQLHRGRPVLIEADAYWLPDAELTYRRQHAKTTLAAVALDPAVRRLGYFHGIGYHVLDGEDYDGLFRSGTTSGAASGALFPYVEFVKCDGKALAGEALVAASIGLLRSHLKHRPAANPVTGWRSALPLHLERLAARDMGFFHLYAFNVPRQLGANFEMLGMYLRWLGVHGEDGLAEAALASRRIAEAAKTLQFQLARMSHRRKFDAAAVKLDPIEADYAFIMSTLAARFP